PSSSTKAWHYYCSDQFQLITRDQLVQVRETSLTCSRRGDRASPEAQDPLTAATALAVVWRIPPVPPGTRVCRGGTQERIECLFECPLPPLAPKRPLRMERP